MVNESKNMYIPEDTLENHQGMLPLAILFLHLFSGKHLVTVHGRVGQGRGMEGGREGGGGDLEMGMGWGKERWRGREVEEGKGVLARALQQMDKCLCFAPLYFLLLQFMLI